MPVIRHEFVRHTRTRHGQPAAGFGLWPAEALHDPDVRIQSHEGALIREIAAENDNRHPAVPRIGNGSLIPNLTKDDFEVAEDGKGQTIKYFTAESNLPLTLGIMIDSSASQVST